MKCILLCVFVMLIFTGCISEQKHDNEPPRNHTTTNQIIWNTVASTDWLMSLLLLGSVAGIFAGLNGMKSGWAAVASCVGGMFIKASLTSTWVYWCCGLLFVGSVVVAIASIIWKNKAVKELIMSSQYLKNAVPDKERVTDIFNMTQTKDTQTLVNSVKSNLKLKGILQ